MGVMLDSYSDPVAFMYLVEQPDFQGKNCLWYLDEFDLYKLLDHPMVDNIMNEYWSGRKVDINSTIQEYSTSYNLLFDKHDLMYGKNIIKEMWHDTFNSNKYTEKTHQFKFFVWKTSIKLRYNLLVLF